MTTDLHDAGTLNQHYAHPGDDGKCIKCVAAPSPAEGQAERDALMLVFQNMLWAVTGDGGRKRAAGAKPPWWRDESHEAAIFSHLNKWKHGERIDHDSGQHPLVHLAWRALAIAYQETRGRVDPLKLEVK